MYNQIKFLPVGPEDSERLKYTESFEINHDQRASGPYAIGLNIIPPAQHINQAPEVSHPQEQHKNSVSSGIRGDIQSYLKNRGSKASSGAVSSFENASVVQSFQNGISKNTSITNKDSFSQNIAAPQKKAQKAVQSRGYRLSQIDSDFFKQVQAEMGQHDIPRSPIDQSNVKVSMQNQENPRNIIEQSNVRIGLQSQVRPYQRQVELQQRQLISLQDSHIPLVNASNQAQYHEQMLKSIKIAPKSFEYEENFSKPQQTNHLTRNLISQKFEKEIISAPVAAINHQAIKQSDVPEYTSINIRDQKGTMIPNSNSKINYNRNLTHSVQQTKQNQQIIIPPGGFSTLPKYAQNISHIRKLDNSHPSQQIGINQILQQHQINHQQKIAHVQEQILSHSIHLPVQQYQCPSNSSKGINFVRNIQHIQPQPLIQLKMPQAQQKSFNNLNKSQSYSRNLQHEQPLHDTRLMINPGDESILSNSSQNKSKLLARNLQHEPVPQTILYVDTGNEQKANFANKKDSSVLSRNLQHEEIPQKILYIDTGKQQNASFDNKKDRSVLSRNLQHEEIPQKILYIDTGKQQNASFDNKKDRSVLSRNLQHEEVPDTHLFVNLGDESVDFAHKKDSSILSRNLQHQQPIPDTQLFINPAQQAQRLSSSRKLPLSRSLQHSQQPIIINEQGDSALEFSNILPKNEPESFSLPVHQLLADQTQLLNSKSKSQFTRNLIHENAAVQEEPKQIRIAMNQNIYLPQTNASLPLKRTLQHQIYEQPIIIMQQQPQQIVQEPIKINQNWGDHTGKLVEPKSQLKYQRNLKQQHYNDPQSEAQSVIPEVSQRVIENEVLQQPQIIQQLKQLPLNFEGVTTFANQRQPILLKRQLLPHQNPLPSLDASILEKTCEGWNPSSKIFNLFKVSKQHQKTAPISFGKARISTALKN